MLFWINIFTKKAIPDLNKNDTNKNQIKNNHTLLFERAFCPHSLHGSMTVEAAVVVPMVLFVWIACVSLSSVVRVHENVQNELTNSAIQMSMMTITGNEMVQAGGLLSTWYEIESLDSLETGGVEKVYGFDFSGSRTEDKNWLDLRVKYRVRLIDGLIPIPDIRLENRVYTRKWTGGLIDTDSLASEEEETQVFVTEYGSVYHSDRFCTHIYLRINRVSKEEAMKYPPCEKCSGGSAESGNTYYVAVYGDCYHSRLGCSGLKRTVKQMDRSEAIAAGCRPCSRCGGG